MYSQNIQEIIPPNDGEPTFRVASFLQPIGQNVTQVVDIPKTPFLHEIFAQNDVKKWPFEIHFNGWKKHKQGWEEWYYRLVIDHAITWLRVGILDGIHSSLHEIPCNKDIILGLCEFWCPSTNTFMFRWGEVTITLEDVFVLGGIPVLGSAVGKKVEGKLNEILSGLERAEKEISLSRKKSSKSKKVSFTAWMKHFKVEEEEGEIDCVGGEFEHAAFLALWLNRFVFPEAELYQMFKVAAHLSVGTSISLAHNVLANLYNDMTFLSKKAFDFDFKNRVNVNGLFHIVQLWVCERFPAFASHLAKPLHEGDPRVARWDNVKVKASLPIVRSRLKEGWGFRWRPYANSVEGWELLPFYEEEEQIIKEVSEFNWDDLPSYSEFCRSCKLRGIKDDQMYRPHRVAMQLGYDQDHPGEGSVSKRSFERDGFRIPSKNFVPGMTRRYYDWWKRSMSCHEEAVRVALGLKRVANSGDGFVVAQNGDDHRPDQNENRCSNDFPWLMRTPLAVDTSMMFELQPSVEAQSNEQPSSRPLLEDLEFGEFLAEPEISRTGVIMSPEVSRSNSRDSHGESVPEAEMSETVMLTSPEMSRYSSKDNHASVSPHSPYKVRITASETEGGFSKVSSDLDHIPLASRIRSTITKNACNKIGPKASAAAASSLRSCIEDSRGSSYENVISAAKEQGTPDMSESDIDHVPLAVRLDRISKRKGAHTPSETSNRGNFQRRFLTAQTDELASGTSDAVSHISRRRSSSVQTTGGAEREVSDNADSCSKGKEELEARVTRLEEEIAVLRADKYGHL